ncbi:protease [Candidatus Aerophobetes bacterium]|uniref:Protease HtpX homolog n=1 Tax=Aerophobetes bacterium TaxID=2030807 RepID=A0A662D969_UNCAE|nr:MAG: protease [Candidatus Aerophobetes bacterium]
MLDLLIFLGLLMAIFLGAGWIIGGFTGMLIAFILAVIVNFFSYWYSDTIVLRMYRARPSKHIELENMLAKLSREAGIPTPKLYVIPIDTPNAFETGRAPNHAAVAYTEGLLKLKNEEIEGVLAHEIAHIKNRDTLLQVMAATIAGAISYLAQFGYWSLFFEGDTREEGNIIGLIAIIIFAPLAALLLRLALSRSREYAADYKAALLTKRPRALASALEKIAEMVKEKPLKNMSSATSHLFIVNPFRQDWFNNLFSTHPPIEERVKRLREM